jgi:hypothetical protein
MNDHVIEDKLISDQLGHRLKVNQNIYNSICRIKAAGSGERTGNLA